MRNNEIILCCGKGKCPILRRIDEGRYEITDDDGNTISIKKNELELISTMLPRLEENVTCSTRP